MSNSIYDLFARVARSRPDQAAIIEEKRRLSYRELSDMVDMIAASLPLGEKVIGVVMRHRAEQIASLLAILKIGAAYVCAEPSFPSGRINFMLKESGANFVITEIGFASKFENQELIYSDCSICEARAEHAGASYDRSGEDLAYILYTSGTTGRPKGVMVTNKNVLHYVKAFQNEFALSREDVVLQYSVCTFDIFVEEVFCSLLNGATLAIAPEEAKQSAEKLARFAQSNKITVISGFPYLLAKLNRLDSLPASLRLLISGGDVLRASQVDNLIGKADIYNTYGPSETTVCASYFKVNGEPLADGSYPIGKPVLGAAVKILNEKGEEASEGQIGEICIYGGGVSLGYAGEREEENKAFVALENGERAYKSGDLGYVLPDGNLAFLRRKDTQVMILGKRVEVLEVESLLYKCEGVREALVRAYEDEEGLAYMIGYVVGEGLKLPKIKRELARNLPDFMIPEFIIQIPEIPLTPNGKPDATRLPVALKG